jgi:hypothetical protein
VGGRALATKYNRGVGHQTGVPGESNNSTRVTFVRVPARMATALALPRGSRANGLVHRHDRTLASRTLCRRGMGFWLAPKRIGRDDGSRNGGEDRITLLNATDGKSLVATVVSRAVKSFSPTETAPRAVDWHSISFPGHVGQWSVSRVRWQPSIHNASTVVMASAP